LIAQGIFWNTRKRKLEHGIRRQRNSELDLIARISILAGHLSRKSERDNSNILKDITGIIGKMQLNLFETRFKCKICGKVLTTKPLLNKHHKEEHNK
jgi:hypothetical protein